MSGLKQQILDAERDAAKRVAQFTTQTDRRIIDLKRQASSPWMLGGAAALGFVLARYRMSRSAQTVAAEQGDDLETAKCAGLPGETGRQAAKPSWSAGLLGTFASQVLLSLAGQWLERQVKSPPARGRGD